MLLPKDINPTSSVYYNGAIVLQELKSVVNKKPVDFLNLYHSVKEGSGMSLQAYIFALDWLFILGIINMNDKGKIVSCF